MSENRTHIGDIKILDVKQVQGLRDALRQIVLGLPTKVACHDATGLVAELMNIVNILDDFVKTAVQTPLLDR